MLKNFNFDKTPIVEIVNEILIDSSKRGASDIHFDPHENMLKVRIRIDGELTDYAEVPDMVAKNLITRIKIISGMNITESRLPQDGSIKATLEDVNLDLRVSSLPTNKGEKIVIRILDYSLSLAGLESLGLSPDNLKKVLKMISEPNGIILVTGATGSGKSTTVYSILQRLNKENTNIISVEDPIEMDITGINQIQTNSEIGLDFATVLRSILRQDPNIIMIGEIRDTETAKIAVRASITGHLVLSTLHTNDSLNTIERLLDMDVERYLLASALTGIISQKLARKLCPHCRKLRPTNDYEKNIIKKVLGKDINEIYTTVGCDKCKNGYNGRIAIHEVLMIDQNIKDAISSNVRKDKLRRLVYNENVVSLLKDGILKVLDGLTTLEELLKIIELDDDSSVTATGLDNAMEANELIKEDTLNHKFETMTNKKEAVLSNHNETTIKKTEENLFDSQENLKPNNQTNNTQINIVQQPINDKVTKTESQDENESNEKKEIDKTKVENSSVETQQEVNKNQIEEKESKVDIEHEETDDFELKLPNSNNKKSIFSNRKDLF